MANYVPFSPVIEYSKNGMVMIISRNEMFPERNEINYVDAIHFSIQMNKKKGKI